MPDSNQENAVLMIIAGPAGSGKSTLCDRLIQEFSSIERMVTCTTRPPREGEIDGQHYFFLSDEEFDRRIENDAFLEWARVHTNRYGTPKDLILEKLNQNIDLVMNIDVQGVATVKEASLKEPIIAERLTTVFIMPPSLDELVERLRGRGQDDEAEIARRIESAKQEVKAKDQFDYVIETRTKDEDFEEICRIWQRAKGLLGKI